jgi:regulator of sirC expression with transglutaminase-like and TPR domain
MYLGISYYYLKDNAVAEKALKAAISLKDDPSTALAHRFLGGMYIQGDRKAEAAMELQKYLDLVPNAPDASRLKATVEDLKKKS